MVNRMPDLRVDDLMTLDPVVIDPDASAAEAERLLKTYRVSGLPVVRPARWLVLSASRTWSSPARAR